MEYDAYHKLSLASIEPADPIPEVKDMMKVTQDLISVVVQQCGGSLDSVLQALPRDDQEYLWKKLNQWTVCSQTRKMTNTLWFLLYTGYEAHSYCTSDEAA